MKNIEKYRDKLLERVNVCNWYDYFNSDDCVQDCKACEERFVKWLFEDSEKPVLDEKERKYLSEVIRPFRKSVIGVCKHFFAEDNKQYISISVRNDSGFSEYINLPNFNSDTMYKGMKAEKLYALEELGL